MRCGGYRHFAMLPQSRASKFGGLQMRIHWFVATPLLFLASPALADHPGIGGAASTGGALHVLSPDTLGQGMLAAGMRIHFVKSDAYSKQELIDFAAAHVHAHSNDSLTNVMASIAYGLTDRLTISAGLPFIYRNNLRAGKHSHVSGEVFNEAVAFGDVSGIGDLTFLAQYRVAESPSSAFSLVAGLKTPTGSTHKRGDDGNRLETEHQPGTGSWDPAIGLAAGATFGTIRLDSSALYLFSNKGAQDTRIGDRLQLGIAAMRRFGPPEDHHDAPVPGVAVEEVPHGHSSWDAILELNLEWEGRQKIRGNIEPDSGGTAVFLSPGARYNSSSGISAAFGIGVPVYQRIRRSHPNNDYRVTFTIGKLL